MKFWNTYPLFRLLIPFISGIIFVFYFQVSFNPVWLILAALLIMLISMISNRMSGYKFRWVFGVLLYFSVFISGLTSTILRTPKYNDTFFQKSLKQGDVFFVRLTEPIVEKPKSVRAFGNIELKKDSAAWISVSGKVMLYFENDSSAMSLKYGDCILISGEINGIPPPANPHQFDYKTYLANNGIYHQAFLRSGDWKKTNINRANPVFKFSEEARFRMLKILEKNGLNGDEYAVASALLLGYKENLEPELRSQYVGAGAMHILSVSGLHVGIIFVVIGFLLKFLDKIRHGRFLKFTIVLFVIWLYAFITGLSPSVMRASVMFSLFAIKDLRKQQSDPYNTLAASAFILLIFDPFILTKIGFQLSYAAVLGIIALFKPIYQLMIFKNKTGDYIWQIIAVSLAAQIGTFPISVLYFHQFPTYFLPANLVVIPLAWLIMVNGIAVMAFFFWGWMAGILALALKNLVFLLNYSVAFVDGLPGSKIEGLVLFMPQVLLIYILFVAITRFFVQKNGIWMVVTLSFTFLLEITFAYNRFKILNQKQLVIYNVLGKTAIDIFLGEQAFSLADSSLLADKNAIDFNLKNARIYAGIHQISNFSLGQPIKTGIIKQYPVFEVHTPNFVEFNKYRLGIIDKDYDGYLVEKPLKLDYLILKRNPRISISSLKEKFAFKKLIFDGSNNVSSLNRWAEECKNLAIPFHNIKTDGAFVADL